MWSFMIATLLSIMFSGMIHCSHESVFHFFVLLNNISLCGYTTFCLSILQLMDIWVVSTFWLLRITLLWAFVYKLCGLMFLFILHIYLGVELLGYMVTLYLYNILRNFQAVLQSSCTILHSSQRCMKIPFLYNLVNTYCICYWLQSSLQVWSDYFTVVLCFLND